MLALTHLIVCLLLIQLLSLDKNDAFVALLFGVFIDVDHLLGLRHYAQANGYAAVFDLDGLVHADGHWKSLMHSPIAFAVVGPLAFAYRLVIPLVFWGVHVLMDYIEDDYLGVLSGMEATFLVAIMIVLIGIRYCKYLESHSCGTLRHYVHIELSRISNPFCPADFTRPQ